MNLLLQHLQQYLAPPVFPEDDEKTRVAALLNVILLVFISLTFFLAILSPFLYTEPFTSMGMVGVMVLLRQGLIIAMQRGRVALASLSFVMMLWVVATVLMLLSGGLGGPHMATYVTMVLVAGLLLGGGGGIVFSFFSALFALLIAFLNIYDLLPETALSGSTPLTIWVALAANLVIVAMFQYLALDSLRRALERARQLAAEAQEANAYKSRLIARVSHELRSPLGAILGLAEMMRYGALGDLSFEQKDAMQKVVVNATYLQRLVGELLDQSRIDIGQMRLMQESFSPTELVTQTCASFADQAQAKGLALKIELADDLPEILIGDFNGCNQIVSNLVNNAIQFTDQGEIEVRVFLSGARHWAIQVRDTGMGIAPEVQTKIYEPFWQVDQSSVRKRGGMGLGLSIVEQYVTLMQGEIKLESDVGSGSTFTVTLPLHRKEVENETIGSRY